jgi:DNA-binding transcriptional regulator PaaX
MLNDGWIEVFRKRMNGKKSLYQISDKGRNIVMDIYRKLNGEEIPTSLSQNPMFQKNVSYSDKVYRNMVKDMNTFIRQQRRQTPE